MNNTHYINNALFVIKIMVAYYLMTPTDGWILQFSLEHKTLLMGAQLPLAFTELRTYVTLSKV